MPESDSSPPCILRLATAFTLATAALGTVVTERPPKSRLCTYMRAWVLRHRGALPDLTEAVRAVLPSAVETTSALRIMSFSLLNSPARMHPCRRFARSLTRTTARLGERCGSVIPFITEDFHLLYLAS